MSSSSVRNIKYQISAGQTCYIVTLSHVFRYVRHRDSGIQKFNGEDFAWWKVQIIDMLVSKDLYEMLENDPPALVTDEHGKATEEASKIYEAEEKAWRKLNMKALAEFVDL